MKHFIIGGAGFIGSNLANKLSKDENNEVIIYDNFTNGKEEFIDKNAGVSIISEYIERYDFLVSSMEGADIVYHFASNPDISKAITEPGIDFYKGTLLTNYVLEAMRRTGVKNLVYASGSGVYGEVNEMDEKTTTIPISTYGASKIAGEALISAYCYMFGINANVFRFANVVGPNQTHGIVYDFIKKLKDNPNKLTVLGNGTQRKSYIYITDVLRALELVEFKGYQCHNVATELYDVITVKEIAELVINIMYPNNKVEIEYGEGDRGWKGDVPVVYMKTAKIRKLGWNNKLNSKQAIKTSIIDNK